jgi:trehalose 6-phosphate phosphatase
MTFKDEADLTTWARGAGRLWLFLDYDGTLADFAPTPAQVEPDSRVIQLLERLSRDARKRLAIISGRKLDDIRALVPVPGLFLGGTYGLDLQTPAGEIRHRINAQAILPVIEKVKARWQALVAGRVGFFLEDKGLAMALHARFAGEVDAGRVLALARQSVADDLPAATFRLLAGHRFLEVAPALADKGETVAFLLREFPWRGSQLVYVGDDDKDAAAFGVVHSHGGRTIWVAGGSHQARPADADYTLESPAAVRRWLEGLSV